MTNQNLNELTAAIEAFADATLAEQQRHAAVMVATFTEPNDAPPLFDDANIIATDVNPNSNIPKLIAKLYVEGDDDDRREIDSRHRRQRIEQHEAQHRDQNRLFDWWPQ